MKCCVDFCNAVYPPSVISHFMDISSHLCGVLAAPCSKSDMHAWLLKNLVHLHLQQLQVTGGVLACAYVGVEEGAGTSADHRWVIYRSPLPLGDAPSLIVPSSSTITSYEER